MPHIQCRYCDKFVEVDDFDFARWCKRELIFCEDCYEDLENNVNKVRRCKH